MENVLTFLSNSDSSSKYVIPENFPYKEAKVLFEAPEVLPVAEIEPLLKWVLPSQDELIRFMVEEKGFRFVFSFYSSEDRIRSGIKKLEKSTGQSTQCRLDSFFKKNTPQAKVLIY